MRAVVAEGNGDLARRCGGIAQEIDVRGGRAAVFPTDAIRSLDGGRRVEAGENRREVIDGGDFPGFPQLGGELFHLLVGGRLLLLAGRAFGSFANHGDAGGDELGNFC